MLANDPLLDLSREKAALFHLPVEMPVKQQPTAQIETNQFAEQYRADPCLEYNTRCDNCCTTWYPRRALVVAGHAPLHLYWLPDWGPSLSIYLCLAWTMMVQRYVHTNRFWSHVHCKGTVGPHSNTTEHQGPLHGERQQQQQHLLDITINLTCRIISSCSSMHSSKGWTRLLL